MKTQNQKRGGFTLTELLVVIIIISILAALSFASLASVRKQSNIDQTQRTIQKIHLLLMEKLDEYQTKRIKVTTTDPQTAAIARTIEIHDLVRMDMPDRLSDLEVGTFTYALPRLSASAESYLRRIKNALGTPLPAPNPTTGEPYENLSAELLYMIIMQMPNAAEQFAQHEIGDTNNNGLKEFVDAWGSPIRFLRWAPGLTVSDIQTNDPVNAHSPFDPHGYYKPTATIPVANRGCTLYPFVFSAGPDKKHGVNVESGYLFQGDPYVHSTGTENNAGEPNSGADTGNGTAENYTDNITNHTMDYGKVYD